MERTTVHFRSGTKHHQALRLAAVSIVLIMVGLAASADARLGSPVETNSPWFVDMNRFALSAHTGFKCEECHGTMKENGRVHPDKENPDFLKKPATRAFDYSRCQKCHKLSYQRYLEGEHAKALAKEIAGTEPTPAGVTRKNPAPTCGDCHSAHYDPSGLSRVAVGKRMIEVCGRCHKAQTASYLENIHGKVGVHLENPAAAFCTDCHQAHTAVSLKQPAAALPVCRRCHPQAAAEFTNVVIHASLAGASDADSPKRQSVLWIQRVKLAAIVVVALSLIFFFGHSLLWLLRELHEKLRKH